MNGTVFNRLYSRLLQSTCADIDTIARWISLVGARFTTEYDEKMITELFVEILKVSHLTKDHLSKTIIHYVIV